MKNKYFYPIYKLKIKSWIKYWLIKQTEFKGVLSDILEGISFYLTDSLNMKFKMFDIIGRSVQDGDPTPENPVPIKNTGDNGSVNEKVQNKNLFDKTKATNGYINFNDGSFTASEQYTSSDFIQVEEGEQYYSNYLTFSSSSFGLAFYNKNKEYIRGNQLFNRITVPDNAEYIRFCVRNSNYSSGTYITDINTLYFVKGNSPTDYVPHSEQNISFPLAQGQKLMEGDYLADDGIHSLWNEDTVNGTTSTFSDAKTNGAYYCNQKVSGNLTGQTITFDTSVTNAIVQYELAQEQVIPYTQEQKEAWEQIKKARTYKNVTHISSEDETPALLKIQYWKEG